MVGLLPDIVFTFTIDALDISILCEVVLITPPDGFNKRSVAVPVV